MKRMIASSVAEGMREHLARYREREDIIAMLGTDQISIT